MFIGRQLRSALVISFFWHFLCFSFVSIVFLPNGIKARQYSSVSFLGSILGSAISIGQVSQASLDRKFYLTEQDSLLRKRGVISEIDIQGGIANFDESPYTSLPAEREIPNPDGLVDVDALKEAPPSAASFVIAKATASEREIIFQPASLKYPEWGAQELKGGLVIFKIYISADGMVEQTINMQGSGDPEVDATVARYIERWRFAPIPEQEVQTQTAKVNLD